MANENRRMLRLVVVSDGTLREVDAAILGSMGTAPKKERKPLPSAVALQKAVQAHYAASGR